VSHNETYYYLVDCWEPPFAFGLQNHKDRIRGGKKNIDKKHLFAYRILRVE